MLLWTNEIDPVRASLQWMTHWLKWFGQSESPVNDSNDPVRASLQWMTHWLKWSGQSESPVNDSLTQRHKVIYFHTFTLVKLKEYLILLLRSCIYWRIVLLGLPYICLRSLLRTQQRPAAIQELLQTVHWPGKKIIWVHILKWNIKMHIFDRFVSLAGELVGAKPELLWQSVFELVRLVLWCSRKNTNQSVFRFN